MKVMRLDAQAGSFQPGVVGPDLLGGNGMFLPLSNH